MKVYVGYDCYDNHCDIWKLPVKVFDDEAKAMVWRDDFKSEDPDEFREYEEFEVE